MDIVKVKNTSYAKYEEVLLRRDNLRKEAEEYHLQYIRMFGDLIVEAFEQKIECIRKKKMIAYCQRLANQGKTINRNALTAFIEKEMADYRSQLADMISDVKTVREAKSISPVTVKKIKTLYYALAKLIHPDMHPELAGDEYLADCWRRIVIAYQYNRLEELEELDALVRLYLENNGGGAGAGLPEIANIEEKIAAAEAEIEEILTTNPYLYKLLLHDEKEIEQKKQEYRDEIASFRAYSARLDEVLGTFEIKEMLS